MAQNLEILELNGWQRFTDNARKVIQGAHGIAFDNTNNQVSLIHVFLSLLENPSVILIRIFEKIALDLDSTKSQILNEIKSKSGFLLPGQTPEFSSELKDLINQSFLVAERLSHVYVGSEHLLLALLEMKSEPFVQELHQLGLTSEKIAEIAMNVGSYPAGILSQTNNPSSNDIDSFRGDDRLGYFYDSTMFFRDMNQQAANGEFLNITGRDKEVERLIHILSRKTKNNPILVGDAGVGKTAVVQGLVQRILAGNVPPSFIDKQVLSLDVSSIIAGAKVRGDVEERILAIVNDVVSSGDKIIFIDEIHMIVGAGAYGGRDPMDIGNILKPYLTDSNLRIIGATTMGEYHKYFDDDPALSRRFQPVEVEEIDKESALSILKNLKKDFERYHGVRISDAALQEAVNLSSKFILDRYLPDKAIDLVDEAAASLKIGKEIQIEPQLSALGQKLIAVQRKKEAAMTANDLSKASRYKEDEVIITDEITDLIEGRHKYSPKGKTVDENIIRRIVVSWTKIPLAAGQIDLKELASLGAKIKNKIKGQDQAIDSVVNAIKRSHLGISSGNRPLGTFLFLGPTGVGKTELAKTIASELFGSGDLLIQLNMSEYMEMHSVSKLVGAPPGYVGYQEGGQLTEQVRRKPYSVVLFDEIEKAHPEVLNILLQILEEGELKDGKGRKASLRNTIVILTSNLGAQEVSRDSKLGFDINIEKLPESEIDEAFEAMRDKLLDNLRDEMRPELLNRLDDILVFRGLNEHDCLAITEIMVDDLKIRLLENKIILEVAPSVYKLINEQGYSKEYGARNIRRKVQELLENRLADWLLSNNAVTKKKAMRKICVKAKGNELVFLSN